MVHGSMENKEMAMAVRVGLVGLGMMGRTHLAGLLSAGEAELVAVCDIDPQKLEGDLSQTAGNIDTGEAGQVDFSAVQRFDTIDALLDADIVDAVDLCVPTDLHAPLSIQALRAGRHVLCEKPMALRSSDARMMLDESRKADRTLMIGHCLRFWPEYRMVREMIRDGRYGLLRSAVFSRRGGRPGWSGDRWLTDPTRSGSAVLDLHIHDVDTLQWMLGSPRGVQAHASVDPDIGVEYVSVCYAFQEDMLVCAEGGWVPGKVPFAMGLTAVFEEATVIYDLQSDPTLTVFPRTVEPEMPAVPPADAYAEEIRYFLRCVQEGVPVDECPPEESLRAVEIVEAEVRSAQTSGLVTLG